MIGKSVLSYNPTLRTRSEGLVRRRLFCSWYCSDGTNDEDAVLCIEGDYGAVLESDSLPFDVSRLTAVSALSIDCAAARNISLASMRGITRVQIGRMQRAGQCYSLPLLPLCLKELCMIHVREDKIITAVKSQRELRSLFIRKTSLEKSAALVAPIRFESLPQDKWSNLEELHLSSCGLQQLPISLSNLTLLKKLDMSENSKLENIAEDLRFKLQNLEELDLRNCGLQQLPISLSSLTALKKLDLSRNGKLKSLPKDIGLKLQNLEELHLSRCGLQQLPISLSNLTALKKLDLSGNSEDLLEDEGFNLQNLEELDLQNCSLQQLPICSSNLTALKKLDLSRNSKLKNLPEDIGFKLQNLEELHLSWCGLQQLPVSLSNLTALEKLDLCGNTKLKNIPEAMGFQLQNLKELNLSWCDLQQLPISLTTLTALKKLDLSGNSKLKNIPEDIGFKLQNLEELRLWNCSLQRIPISLSNLTALKKLDLGKNREFLNLPKDLKNLEELRLRNCGLQQLPTSLSTLTALKMLDLSGNSANLPDDIGLKLQNLEELRLSWCDLQQLPTSLSNLTALKKLNLSGNSNLKNLPEDIGIKLQNVEELDLHNCGLQQLPISLSDLTALKKLDLSRNSENLPEDIGFKLQNLEELKLWGCGLQKLPISLSNLTALKKLDLSSNRKLKNLPEDIGLKLRNLEELHLWSCGLQQLPISLSNLTALKKLTLSGNRELKNIPKDIGFKLQNLEELRLLNCGLQQLPISLSNLTALKQLSLSDNSELKNLPKDIGLKLQNLEELDLRNCCLQQLPDSLSNLTALKKLDLSTNSELTNLPEDMLWKLTSLKELNLQYCKLKELPSSLGSLKDLDVASCRLTRLPSSIGRLKELNCSGNPITFPPIGVWKQGLASIRAYFSSEMLTSSRRVKIVVLGESCSGKTSLFQTMLRNATFCTCAGDRTIGVEEYELTFANKRAKIIDCGGQRCYLLTNQLFVSENGLVVIVVDAQRYELTETSFHEYIGKYMQVVYERNENCYVACVFTKIDLLSNDWNPRPYQEEFTRQMQKFRETREAINSMENEEENAAFIKNQNVRVDNRVVFTSAKDVGTVAKFRDFIDNLTDDEGLFPSAGDIVPETWYDFEERVERECRLAQNGLSVLKVDFLNELCGQFKLSKDEVLIVLRYYHQVGTLLYFDQSRLADVVFGSSKKIVEALKQIFRHDYDTLAYESGTTEISPERFQVDKSELSSNATLSIPLLKALLRGQKLDPESVNIFVKMLLSFDFAYVKGGHKENSEDEADDIVNRLEKAEDRLLVPWLLSQDCPSDAIESFPADCPINCIEVQLSYSFAFTLPLGIFQLFSARCHQISSLIRHWNKGFTLSYGPVKAKFTCEELATNAAIRCKCRTPKSRNALDRLFHLFWRCIIQLQKLLKTFPGCLYSIFFDYSNGDRIMKKQQVQIPSKNWHLNALAASKPRELEECSRSIKRGIN